MGGVEGCCPDKSVVKVFGRNAATRLDLNFRIEKEDDQMHSTSRRIFESPSFIREEELNEEQMFRTLLL